MIRVSRDEAKLGDTPFVRFWVCYPSEGKPFGAYSLHDPEKRSDGIKTSSLPIEQVFEEARWFAKSNSIPGILIDDPKQQFDFKLWVLNGLIDYLDGHS
jgi:hypothetical protein